VNIKDYLSILRFPYTVKGYRTHDDLELKQTFIFRRALTAKKLNWGTTNKLVPQINQMSDNICPICYEDINARTGSVNLSCAHTFHLTCITTWFSRQDQESCPCCRKEMGEKETVPVVESESDDEAETRSYVSDESEDEEQEPDGVCRNSVNLTRQDLSDLLKKISPSNDPNFVYLYDFEWEYLVKSFHYTVEEIDGEDTLCFCQDELRELSIQLAHQDLPVEMWHEILKKKMDTVTLTYSEFIALERRLAPSLTVISKFVWSVMVESNLYIKEKPTYLGEIPICFTFFHLATTFLKRTGVDLSWKEWKNLLKAQNTPLTVAFISASLDFSIPLSLPNRHVITDCDRAMSRSHWTDTLRFGEIEEGAYIREHAYAPSATLFD